MDVLLMYPLAVVKGAQIGNCITTYSCPRTCTDGGGSSGDASGDSSRDAPAESTVTDAAGDRG
jgi:hypothetical protein